MARVRKCGALEVQRDTWAGARHRAAVQIGPGSGALPRSEALTRSLAVIDSCVGRSGPLFEYGMGSLFTGNTAKSPGLVMLGPVSRKTAGPGLGRCRQCET